MKVYRLSEMPASSEAYYSPDNDILVKYIGPTTATYTSGYFYRSVTGQQSTSYSVPKDSMAETTFHYINIDLDQTVTTTTGICYYKINNTQYDNTAAYAALSINAHAGDTLGFYRWTNGNTYVYYKKIVYNWEEATEYNTKVFTRDNMIYLLNELTTKLQINHIGE